jgi:methylmalonyl-CoA mutase N-terminal domain/subunit
MLQSGEIPKVGVNCWLGDQEAETPAVELYAFDPTVAEAQIAKLERIRNQRDSASVERALDRLRDEAQGTSNLMEPMLDAVKAYATIGEIANTMKSVFGEYREPVGI